MTLVGSVPPQGSRGQRNVGLPGADLGGFLAAMALRQCVGLDGVVRVTDPVFVKKEGQP
ncbi:hypothetical protein Afer_1730 [Acidimicrobium ferrooxidans DSM 10331]|uniref:Uncharacterized protein n=1 Tax=Acidimicrobium ferrooxidans (strain DSM 10331 / JCM 15462 / NBRC 103882 / ICP) TaxID=525909 RepID=C7M0Y8_ACIFD|nr:hypothetical protein [Acidimicrobium ferrooxidans]ACU54646.1 hypothetical protein Afer_1730 [Acidimicrobium ferrooxidans DSM 10331]